MKNYPNEVGPLQMDLDVKVESTNNIIDDVGKIIHQSQRVAYYAVDIILLRRNWLIGKRIYEEELKETRKENYGLEIIKYLSKELVKRYGKGFTKTNLYNFYRFYTLYKNIFHAVSGKSSEDKEIDNNKIFYAPRKQSSNVDISRDKNIFSPVSRQSFLSWTHYRILISIDDPKARDWYEKEALASAWSYRTLQRNIQSQYYYRILGSKDKEVVKKEMEDRTMEYQINKLDHIKNPLILDFLGLDNNANLLESDLEKAIINNIQRMLMELGRGYAFVGRQYHLQTIENNYYVDLVFYNYILKCFVLIDLKTTKNSYEDVGQMDMYVKIFDEEIKRYDDNPTIGIMLCSDTNKDVARYSILNGNEQLFASKYKLYLPTEVELLSEIEHQKALYYLELEEKKEV